MQLESHLDRKKLKCQKKMRRDTVDNTMKVHLST
jgi:hypothetical protein